MRRVLVIDDDEDIRALLAELLRLSDFDPQLAASGVDGLEQLAAGEPPSLVLLDVQMPAMDGWNTLRRIRADPRTTDVPVVLCTVKAGMRDRALGWTLGCDGYLTKPFAIADLTGELEAVLARDREALLARRRDELRAAIDAAERTVS